MNIQKYTLYNQGRTQVSVNGGAQLSAVTRPYIRYIEYNRRNFIGPVRRAPLRGSGGMLPKIFLDFRLSEMVSDALFKQKRACQCLTKIT